MSDLACYQQLKRVIDFSDKPTPRMSDIHFAEVRFGAGSPRALAASAQSILSCRSLAAGLRAISAMGIILLCFGLVPSAVVSHRQKQKVGWIRSAGTHEHLALTLGDKSPTPSCLEPCVGAPIWQQDARIRLDPRATQITALLRSGRRSLVSPSLALRISDSYAAHDRDGANDRDEKNHENDRDLDHAFAAFFCFAHRACCSAPILRSPAASGHAVAKKAITRMTGMQVTAKPRFLDLLLLGSIHALLPHLTGGPSCSCRGSDPCASLRAHSAFLFCRLADTSRCRAVVATG